MFDILNVSWCILKQNKKYEKNTSLLISVYVTEQKVNNQNRLSRQNSSAVFCFSVVFIRTTYDKLRVKLHF